MIDRSKIDSSDPFFEPEMTPPHRSRALPAEISGECWAKMTPTQKKAFLDWRQWYWDELTEERRAEVRRQRGY